MRIFLAVAVLLCGLGSSASAQEPWFEPLAGIAVPIDLNGWAPEGNDDPDQEIGYYGIAPAFWVEGRFLVASRVSLHAYLDVPRTYARGYNHPGSGAFEARYRHRDVLLSGLVGVTVWRSPSSRTIVLAGPGVAFARTAGTYTATGIWIPRGTYPYEVEETRPTLVMGGEQVYDISPRVRLVAGARIRFVTRGFAMSDSGAGRWSVSPRLGVAFRF